MTIYGWDASHYDSIPDGGLMVAEGIKFMTHKAGGDANDAELGAWWAEMKPFRDRVLLGAYWVLYPGNPTSRADAFLARLDSQCPGWRDGPFMLQIDAEIWGGDSSTKPSVAECNAFADRLVAKMPKLRPAGYLPKWVYGDVSGFRYPLWASAYVSGSGVASVLYPGDSSSRWNAYGKAPDILQFTSSATIAGQTTCDANAYRGTLAELTALVAPGWETEMAIDPSDLPAIAKAVWEYNLTDPYDTAATKRQLSAGTWLRYTPARSMVDDSVSAPTGLAKSTPTGLAQILAAIATEEGADTQAVAQAVLAGIAEQADDAAATVAQLVVAALPADEAAKVVDELKARL